MVSLSFTLNPESCGRVHDVLTCLAKFGESLTIEARPAQLAFSALNSSKSAYASIVFDRDEFFTHYEFVRGEGERDNRFACSIMNKALLSVFRARLADPRNGEAAIDRCEVTVQDRMDKTKCRFNVKIICRHGVTKTYKLTYESVDIMHALFDKNRSVNSWKVSSKLLKDFIDFFGPKTEQLDFFSENGRFTLTSYTEKITNGREILKQPLQTAVTVDTLDFEEFNVQDNLHIAISVKDFRTVVIHAETLRTNILALYSQPSRPLQFSYGAHGIRCEFTLMTIGDPRSMPTPAVSRATTRELQHGPENQQGNPNRAVDTSMQPPEHPAARSASRSSEQLGTRQPSFAAPSNEPPSSESLFVPQDAGDRQWDPSNYRDEEGDMLGWDASADNDVPFQATFRDSNPHTQGEIDSRGRGQVGSGIAPTQRASQVRGLFDD